MHQSSCYIITGGMGSGKTSLLNEISRYAGYQYIPEIADTIIDEQLSTGGDALPWISTRGFLAFQQELLTRRIAAYKSLKPITTSFSDRSIPDAIPFFYNAKVPVPQSFIDTVQQYRYNARMFLLPPWVEIYQNTNIRPQPFAESLNLWMLMRETYLRFGYDVVEVPKVPLAERVEFVLNHL